MASGLSNIGVEFQSEQSCSVTSAFSGKFNVTLDRIFNLNASQEEIYEYVAKPLIDDVLKSYNGTIFAYGQSGSGKTFTMYGRDIVDEKVKGIIPRALY